MILGTKTFGSPKEITTFITERGVNHDQAASG